MKAASKIERLEKRAAETAQDNEELEIVIRWHDGTEAGRWKGKPIKPMPRGDRVINLQWPEDESIERYTVVQ